ncbi:ATP-binding cassette domain-containing protein [Salinirarus marinus]|uniref:ATP-binding cassette domain-containing protein n=1 Tax=Salinirarus marinus TaxID=3068310 RepID=UPI003C6CB957
MTPAVDVSNLSVSLGGVSILDDVTTSVERGQFVGLVGPNGAGKTTLIRSLNGVLTPDAGTVLIEGERIHDLSSKAASRLVATVPQSPSLSFAFDVRETVEMGRMPHVDRFEGTTPADRDAVERAMERTDVTQFADRSITDVSGGERQRVFLARALAQETPVLLLDEPTSNLDVNHQIRTLELVRELADEGRTVVAAIHELDLAARYCDELRLLYDGTVRADGSPETVLSESNVERAFDTSAAVAENPVTGSTEVVALPDAAAATGHVHVVGGGGAAARYLYALDAAGYEVSVGAVNEGDTDASVADRLDCDAVTVPPYAPVDDEARAAVDERVRAADAVLVADVVVGSGNLPNLEAALAADSLVVVEGRPFAARNHAGEAAARTHAALRERGTVVGPDEAIEAVRAAVDHGNGGPRREDRPSPDRS